MTDGSDIIDGAIDEAIQSVSDRFPKKKKTKLNSVEKEPNFFIEVIKVVVISLAIIIPVRYYLIKPFYVKGASMEPNFYNYEYLIIDEISYRFHPPGRGDVVVVQNPATEGKYFIKRIIGLPGEIIEIRNEKVYINGDELDESAYFKDGIQTWGKKTVELQEGEYYVLGDNRDASLDSRVFGPVTQDDMIGRTWIRAWPLDRITHFTEVDYNMN